MVLDLYARKVVGWAMAPTMHAELVCAALQLAIAQRQSTPGLIVHSDRGSQYASALHQALLARHSLVGSMSRKGNCWDNAAIESFFGTLKAEYYHLERPDSIDTLEAGVHDYVHYYNHERIKLRLNGLSPVEYRLRSTA